MTPQEEQALVQIIVQCVRAVLETYTSSEHPVLGQQASAINRGLAHPANHNEGIINLPPTHGSRFVDVVSAQAAGEHKARPYNGNAGGTNANAANLAGRNRDDVRQALQRFLRSSESALPAPEPKAQQPQEQPQKRQLITQADILSAYQQGRKVIALQPDAIVTPLARQVAKEKGIELQ